MHYNPIINHAYVDLGLPSGTLWATMNVGANSETDYGLYFAWGDTQGYADASTKEFSWSDYKFNPSGDGSTFTKYNTTDGLTVLDIEDDAARANWGGDWHMPTDEQCEELFNTTYITNEWVTDYNNSGINGCLFTSVSNGNTLFIPAAGWCYNGNSRREYGKKADCWTKVRSSNKDGFAVRFGADNRGNTYTLDYQRFGGYPVRGVISPTVTPTPIEEPIIEPAT